MGVVTSGYVVKVTILLLYFNELLLWLRGYVIFVKIKIIFFNFKIKLLYRPKVIHNYLQLILFSTLLSHVYIIKDN